MPFVRGENETSWQDFGWFAALAMHVLQSDGNAQHQQRREVAENVFELASVRTITEEHVRARASVQTQNFKVLGTLANAAPDR